MLSIEFHRHVLVEVQDLGSSDLTGARRSIRLLVQAEIVDGVRQHDVVDALRLSRIPVDVVGLTVAAT